MEEGKAGSSGVQLIMTGTMAAGVRGSWSHLSCTQEAEGDELYAQLTFSFKRKILTLSN